MTIRQLNANYLVNEDRILFRLNTHDHAEYRLWLTRRVTLFLLAATAHLLQKKLEQIYSSDAAKALSQFGKQAILDATNDAKDVMNSFDSAINFPIGADPLLVMDVTCSLSKNDEKLAYIDRPKEQLNNVMSIDFVLPGGAHLNLKLPENLVQGMLVLLDQIRQSAGWGEAVLVEKNIEKKEESVDLKSSSNISIH